MAEHERGTRPGLGAGTADPRDAADLGQRIAAAWAARDELAGDPTTDAYRLLHGWGEGCPGLEIDRYGDAVVIEYRADLAPQLGRVVEVLDGLGGFSRVVARPRGSGAAEVLRGAPFPASPPAPAPAARAALAPAQADPSAAPSPPAAPRGADPIAAARHGVDPGAVGRHGVDPAAAARRCAGPAGSRCVVRELGLRFEIDLARRGNPGLYLDARPARRWIRDNAGDRRVLNLFAWTGSLGVAAAAGGARSVTQVDSHGASLAWCRRNSELNGVVVDRRDLARMNIYQHLRRAQAGRQRYDAIIVDPPPGPDRPRYKDRTPGRRGLVALARHLGPMLAAGGWLLCFFHHDPRAQEVLEDEVCTAAGVPLEPIWRGQSGTDFPESDPARKLRITALRRRA